MSGAFGHDIVCSAVSALAIATINNIEQMAGVALPVELSDGYLYASVPDDLNAEEDTKTQFLLTAFANAIKGIEAEYKDYLEVKIN